MMFLRIIPVAAIVSFLVGLASAAGPLIYEDDNVSNANCQRKTYQIESRANRTVFNKEALGVARNINQTQITQLFVNFTTGLVRNDTAPFQKAFVTGTKEVTQTFGISGVYCEPKSGRKSDTLQILVHGIGFDGNYWNFHSDAYGVSEEKYSYVHRASKAGYATFRIDRLGTGASEKPEDGYNVVQGPTEVGILTKIADLAKNSNQIGGRKWGKSVLVGHSYGSVQSNAVSKARPDLVDGVVLTGFSTYATGIPFYFLSTVYTQAKTVFPKRLGSLPDSYLVTATQYSGQQNFAYPYFVEDGANKLQRATEQAVTQGAIFTIGSLGGPTTFTGPAYVLLPDKDFIFALSAGVQNGNDLAQASVKALYPQSRNATSYIAPNTGHGIAFHSTASSVNDRIIDFFKSNNF